jgi:hypothetical protein
MYATFYNQLNKVETAGLQGKKSNEQTYEVEALKIEELQACMCSST